MKLLHERSPPWRPQPGDEAVPARAPAQSARGRGATRIQAVACSRDPPLPSVRRPVHCARRGSAVQSHLMLPPGSMFRARDPSRDRSPRMQRGAPLPAVQGSPAASRPPPRRALAPEWRAAPHRAARGMRGRGTPDGAREAQLARASRRSRRRWRPSRARASPRRTSAGWARRCAATSHKRRRRRRRSSRRRCARGARRRRRRARSRWRRSQAARAAAEEAERAEMAVAELKAQAGTARRGGAGAAAGRDGGAGRRHWAASARAVRAAVCRSPRRCPLEPAAEWIAKEERRRSFNSPPTRRRRRTTAHVSAFSTETRRSILRERRHRHRNQENAVAVRIQRDTRWGQGCALCRAPAARARGPCGASCRCRAERGAAPRRPTHAACRGRSAEGIIC